MARVLAQKLSALLGGNFYVENQAGAGGTLAAGAVAGAPADGHTLLIANQDVIVQPIIKSKVPYDPFKSFTPVTPVVTAPEMIVVHPSVTAKDMKELIALLKANPGKYSYASPGFGTTPHLAGEWLFKVEYGLLRHPRAVPGRRASGAIDARRADADLPQRAAGGGAACPGRHDARARGRGSETLAVPARRADAGRGRDSRS